MSICTQESIQQSANCLMTNHHDSGLVGGLSSTVHTWRERRRTRRELAEWSKRDLHDVGLSWSELSAEAAKPFWRA